MSGFAASYYHESNNAWLNDLVSDIIAPDSRSQSRTSNRDQIDDSAELSASHAGNSSLSSHTFSRKRRYSSGLSPVSQLPRDYPRSPLHNSGAHYSYRPTSQSSQSSTAASALRSTASPNPHIVPIHEDGEPLQLEAFYHAPFSPIDDWQRDSAYEHRDTPSSQRALLPHSADSEVLSGHHSFSSSQQHVERSSPLRAIDVLRYNRQHRQSGWSDDTKVADEVESKLPAIPSRQSREYKTSLGRTLPEKPHFDIAKPPLARIATDVSEAINNNDVFIGFAPHPAVRPFSSREVLGEAAGPGEDDDHIYPAKLALMLIVIGICLSVFIVSVNRSIVTTAIPEITATFQSYDDIGWYGSAYFLTASAFQPLYGRVYMSFNSRWTFLVALAVFELGSLLCALSPSSFVLILGRAIQGVGSAGILTGAFIVATHSVPLQGRPVLFAFVGILYGVGSLAGPLIGGVVTDLLTWRWAFWINLPVGAVTFVAVFFFFKPRKSSSQKETPSLIKRILALDLVGNAIVLGACIMLFLALQLSENRGSWSNAPVIGLLVGFGVATGIFIGWLFYRGESALIPPRIISQRTVASSCGIAFFLYGGLLVHAYFLPLWFQAVKGDSAIRSGVNMIPYMLANALFSLMAGIFVSKNGLFAPPAILGCAVGTIGCGLLTTLNADTSTGRWLGYEILTSAGLGMAIQQGFSAVQTALPLEEVPIGTAAVVACQSLGGAIFVSIGNTVFQDKLLDPNNARAVPGVDIRTVLESGATMFRSLVPADELPAMVNLYNHSLRFAFVLAIPLIGCAFLCSLCMEWRSVRTKQGTAKKTSEAEKA